MKPMAVRHVAAIAVAAGALALSPALAQRQMEMSEHMPKYDTATEATFMGTVTEVMTETSWVERTRAQRLGARRHGHPRLDQMRMVGAHLMLETGGETVEVHVGPSSFVEANGFTFAKGDYLEVVGSRIEVWGTEAIVAREINKGDRLLTLRDGQGIPVWSKGKSTT